MSPEEIVIEVEPEVAIGYEAAPEERRRLAVRVLAWALSSPDIEKVKTAKALLAEAGTRAREQEILDILDVP